MQREIIRPSKTASRNPVQSPAVRYGDLVFTSGMVGRDPDSGGLVRGGIREQARQTLENIRHVVEAAGTSLDHTVKATCFLADISDRPAFNDIYQEYFTATPPARTCVQAGRLGEGILVEVEVIVGMGE